MALQDPLGDELTLAFAALHPIQATNWGVPGHDHAWDDFSPAGHAAARATLEGFRARVSPLGAGGDAWDRLARDVLEDFLSSELDRLVHEDHLVDLNSIASPMQMMRMAFDLMDTSTDVALAAVASRLEGLGAALDGYQRTLGLGLERGRAVAARQVVAVITQARTHAGDASGLRGFAERASSGALRERLTAAEAEGRAAFGRFATWLEGAYLPRARPDDGVGRARYVREARRYLGMELDPDETYAWGFREIAAIEAQMGELAERVAPGRSVAEVLTLLRTDPAHTASDVDAFLDAMRARQRDAMDRLIGTHFDVAEPVRTLDVKRAPPGGPIGAYYCPPTDGFARAGCVWYSVGDGRALPIFDQVATAYHEGFPGHHLQIGTQISLTDRLSRLHRVADGYLGYAEGWALYAEQLMAEVGAYEKPEYLFGMLACQMTRACRVVIDIGAHLDLPIPGGQPFHPGARWTYDLGVEVLVDRCGLDLAHAQSEMTRYLGWPAQAISYKVGQRALLELRERERARLGAAFDLKAFHARLLGSGNVGLDHLRRLFA